MYVYEHIIRLHGLRVHVANKRCGLLCRDDTDACGVKQVTECGEASTVKELLDYCQTSGRIWVDLNKPGSREFKTFIFAHMKVGRETCV
jgi:hypothetical protein